MKYTVIALAITAFAGSASAAEKITDVDYLKANRCRGLATSIQGVVDPAALNSFIKSERGSRAVYIVDRGGRSSIAPGGKPRARAARNGSRPS